MLPRLTRRKFWTTAIALVLLSLSTTILVREIKSGTGLPERRAASNQLTSLPPVILWAWERPENLLFIDPQKTGVAFLAKTVYLRADRVVARPRLQPLNVPENTKLVAVARIESDRFEPPNLSELVSKNVASEISQLAKLPNIAMVQVDFDATLSEREFYRRLLYELRRQLPESTGLSITALASWCQGDNWLDQLPVDEAVPMLFRMGVEKRAFLAQLAAAEGFNSRICRDSAGISTDEPLVGLSAKKRLYVFNPRGWSVGAVNQLMEDHHK